jgi:membrane protease YdiL (CAAX protease family)
MTTGRLAERGGTFVAALVAWLVFASAALAASPSPDPIGGDPRSSGQGPGLVGDPLFALLAVVAIGVASVVVTLIYVRLTAHREG